MFDWFWEFLYLLLKWILYLIDFVVDIFRLLAGITPMTIDNEETDLFSYMLQSVSVVRAFLLVVAIALVLVVIFTIIAIIRKQYLAEKESRSIGAILGQAMKSCLMFLLVPILFLSLNTLIVVVIKQLDLATNPYFEDIYYSGASAGTGYNGFSIGGMILYVVGFSTKRAGAEGFITGSLDYMNTDLVWTYFDLKELNYFLGYLAGIIILVLFVKSLFTFVERIFTLLTLFIVSPISCSSSVLDDGARFKLWRDAVINKFLTAYSILIGINLYFIIIPLIMSLDFGMGTFGNYLIQLFFIVGGAFAVNRLIGVIGNLINSGAGTQAQMESDMAGRGLMGGIRAGIGTVKSVLGAAGKAYTGVKNAAGIVTPLDRIKARGQQLRQAKLETRSAGAANKWKENFYKKNPDAIPKKFNRNDSSDGGLKDTLGGKGKSGEASNSSQNNSNQNQSLQNNADGNTLRNKLGGNELLGNGNGNGGDAQKGNGSGMKP